MKHKSIILQETVVQCRQLKYVCACYQCKNISVRSEAEKRIHLCFNTSRHKGLNTTVYFKLSSHNPFVFTLKSRNVNKAHTFTN